MAVTAPTRMEPRDTLRVMTVKGQYGFGLRPFVFSCLEETIL
jgi:hypothetical protein